MPATALRCRDCETDHALEAVGVCSRCFGPLDPVYDRDALRRQRDAASRSPPGPPSLWRYAPLLPVEPPAEPRLAPGFTPLVARAAARGGARPRRAVPEARHRQPDALVQGPGGRGRLRRRRRSSASTTLACSSTGNLANAVAARAAAEGLEAAVFCPADLEPEKLTATAVYGATLYAVDGTYDDCSRLTVELSFELPWAFVNVGLRELLRRGLEDARVRDRRAARLASCPTSSSRRSPPGRCSRKLHQGFSELLELGLVDGRGTAARRRPGGGLRTGRDGLRRRSGR